MDKKVSNKHLCLVLLLTYQIKSSHDLNHFQNKSAAAGAGSGFHLSPGNQRNKSPKAMTTFSCRPGHPGTVRPSSSLGASLVSASGPAREMAFLSCCNFQTYVPGEKKRRRKNQKKQEGRHWWKKQTGGSCYLFSERDLKIRARLPQA